MDTFYGNLSVRIYGVTLYWTLSGTWILDSNRLRDSGFFELYFGFQSPGLQDSTNKISPDSGFHKQTFSHLDSGIQIPLYIGRGQLPIGSRKSKRIRLTPGEEVVSFQPAGNSEDFYQST